MLYVATIQENRLVLSNHNNVDYEDFDLPDLEDQSFVACYDTLIETLQTIVENLDESHSPDFIFFVGAFIGANRINACWFAVDSNREFSQIDPSELPNVFDFGTADIYWEK